MHLNFHFQMGKTAIGSIERVKSLRSVCNIHKKKPNPEMNIQLNKYTSFKKINVIDFITSG